jgi:hypothetical protein
MIPKSDCDTCAQHVPGQMFCKAFPKGIPEDILYNGISHKIPYKGDNGILYKEAMPEGLQYKLVKVKQLLRKRKDAHEAR